MWYASSMPRELPEEIIDAADAAVVFAQQVRRTHRRRTTGASKQRERDIAEATKRIRDAMAPIRTEVGRFPYGPQTTAAERNRQFIRKASDRLQRERRKLWKMANIQSV